MTGRALILRGNARRLPLADASVDLCVTSPPFWSLRSYTDAGAHYAGQLGDEPTPAEYLANLWAVTAELARVLKPTGSLWIELGDKYASDNRGSGYDPKRGDAKHWPGGARSLSTQHGIPQKSLLGLPWRYAIGCIDQLGLILRAEVIWEHTNGLPESVRDRVRRSHSTWFHFVKQPRYYSAIDEIREAHEHHRRDAWGNASQDISRGNDHNGNRMGNNPLGKLPGSVWSVPSEPLQLPDWLGVDHYAASGTEWPRRLILGWSPPGICVACGQGRVPVVERQTNADAWKHLPLKPGDLGRFEARPRNADHEQDAKASGLSRPGWRDNLPEPARILGYVCACTPHTARFEAEVIEQDETEIVPNGWVNPGPHVRTRKVKRVQYHLDGWTPPPTRPAVILDPFMGTGTTVLVARALGRFGVGVDLSADYCRAARWRIFRSGHAGKAVARTWRERQGMLLP